MDDQLRIIGTKKSINIQEHQRKNKPMHRIFIAA